MKHPTVTVKFHYGELQMIDMALNYYIYGLENLYNENKDNPSPLDLDIPRQVAGFKGVQELIQNTDAFDKQKCREYHADLKAQEKLEADANG